MELSWHKGIEEAMTPHDRPVIIGLIGTDEQNREMINKLSDAGSEVKQIDSWSGVPIIEVA